MVQSREGQLPHIEWLDLKNDNTFSECAVMKHDPNGNIYFFQVNELDTIDKKRLSRILHGRHAKTMALWDLMGQVTLNNGVNALQYFHQLVKVVTPSGVIYTPRTGMVGGPGMKGTRVEPGRVSMDAKTSGTAMAALDELTRPTAKKVVKTTKKKVGRPKKKVKVVTETSEITPEVVAPV